ncbi:formylmethanofuran dehydrogenase subunit E [Methanococcus voltae PS]|uniref:Formylmethanofuran dehydrogenase subunit E n=1 Tax=Methanococcus voltae PS TaxID=523842 RepID=A0ABT2EXU8_METVO|nr:FmdE family protein [Methanococcus voltae]MCS3922786.1 formylmethanofuran dehydrogenase subunit E [Methanococcus voltae PS]
MDETYQKVLEFHGHECPGIATGYRVAKYILENFSKESEDEELVAIVENNACGVDAIQVMLSCTFGKGNIKFVDHGKMAFTFYCRETGKGLRIYVKGVESDAERKKYSYYLGRDLNEQEAKELAEFRKDVISRILNAEADDLFKIEEVTIKEPKKARIYNSLVCENCGEYFMEIKGRTIDDKVVCKDCFNKIVHMEQ